MIRLIGSLLLIVFCNVAVAQQSMLALYKYDIPDAAAEHNKLLDQRPVLNESYKNGDTGKYENALAASIVKLYYSTKIITCICNEHYNAVGMYDADSIKHMQTSFNHYLTLRASGALYHILSYDSNSCYTYYKYKDTIIENCRAILGHKVIKTGHTEKIGRWQCDEYSTEDENGNKILLWYSKALPWFVNPGVYGPDVKQGLVRIKYKGVSITLYETRKIKRDVQWPQCNKYLATKADLLQWCVSSINNALGQ